MKPKITEQTERDTAVAYRPEQVAAILNVGRTKVFEMIRSGDLRARKVGRATILLENEIREDIAKFPFIGSNPAPGARAAWRIIPRYHPSGNCGML